jgi:hypothetical protein
VSWVLIGQERFQNNLYANLFFQKENESRITVIFKSLFIVLFAASVLLKYKYLPNRSLSMPTPKCFTVYSLHIIPLRRTIPKGFKSEAF